MVVMVVVVVVVVGRFTYALQTRYKELYHLRSTGIKSQIGLVASKYEKLKTFLQSDKYARELGKREKQMRNHEKLIFESSDFIASKVSACVRACVWLPLCVCVCVCVFHHVNTQCVCCLLYTSPSPRDRG